VSRLDERHKSGLVIPGALETNTGRVQTEHGIAYLNYSERPVQTGPARSPLTD
jgi:hypothetical protein